MSVCPLPSPGRPETVVPGFPFRAMPPLLEEEALDFAAFAAFLSEEEESDESESLPEELDPEEEELESDLLAAALLFLEEEAATPAAPALLAAAFFSLSFRCFFSVAIKAGPEISLPPRGASIE